MMSKTKKCICCYENTLKADAIDLYKNAIISENELAIADAKLGMSYCDKCIEMRAREPVLFDFMLKIIKANVNAEIGRNMDNHISLYSHIIDN